MAEWWTATILGKALTAQVGVPDARADHSRSNQDHVDVGEGLDQAESDVVSAGEEQHVARLQVGGYVLVEDLGHHLVGNQKEDDIRLRCCLIDTEHGEAIPEGRPV